MAICGVGN